MIRRLRSILFQNWMPKLACLLIAGGLWFWVAIQQSGEERFQVPINYQNVRGDLIVSEQSNRQVSVALQGPQSILLRTDPSDITVTLDLSKQTAGAKTLWSRELTIQHPRGLEINSVRPRTLRVVLEQRSRRTLTIQPTITEEPPEGYKYNLTVSPETGTVIGPQPAVSELETLRLRGQSLGDRTASFNATLPVQLPESVQLEYPADNAFELRVEVYQVEITRTIKNVPVTVREVPAGMKGVVEPGEIDLVVRGPRDQVENLNPEDVDVSVKAPEKGSDLVIRVASIQLPDGVELIEKEREIPAFKVHLENL